MVSTDLKAIDFILGRLHPFTKHTLAKALGCHHRSALRWLQDAEKLHLVKQRNPHAAGASRRYWEPLIERTPEGHSIEDSDQPERDT